MGFPTSQASNFDAISIQGAILDPVPKYSGVRGGLPCGRTLYVCSGGGMENGGFGDGTDINAPLATLGGATGGLARLGARTNKGDVIYVLPGHTESVSSADYFSHTGAASGFSVIGLGSGNQRPVFNWTVAGSTWLLDTAGVEVANCRLNLAGADATGTLTVTTPITVSAAGCRIAGCEINWGQSTDNGCGSTLGAIAVVAGTRFEFVNNYCPSLDTAGTLPVSFLSLNGADDALIAGNVIYGGTTATTVGAIHCVTTASLRVRILNNIVQNLVASSTKAISSAVSGVTGTLAGNMLRVNSGILGFTVSANLSVDAFNNYTNNTVNKNGALDVGAGTST